MNKLELRRENAAASQDVVILGQHERPAEDGVGVVQGDPVDRDVERQAVPHAGSVPNTIRQDYSALVDLKACNVRKDG